MSAARSLTPSAARLTMSLRDIGYDFPAAVADLVDNSVSAGAKQVDVCITFEGAASRVLVADDGAGMTANSLLEALRFGTRRAYQAADLGRYGLGLKTASLSQARCVTVISRRGESGRVAARKLDLDLVASFDDWLVVDPGRTPPVQQARALLGDHSGTVVLWEKLDRVLPEQRPEGGWARRRLASLAARTTEHLAMVFHRFLADDAAEPLVITVNGEKVAAWDPFATDEPATRALPVQTFEIFSGGYNGQVKLSRFVLPSRDAFSTPAEFDRLSGPLKWNRQQGLYIYRADRLVQWGGWAGIRGIDEHTKLGRASLDFPTSLDPVFQVNVAKMRVTVPAELRQMLERPITELCLKADDAYRKTAKRSGADSDRGRATSPSERHLYGLALRSAAMQAGEYDAFKRVLTLLQAQAPEVVRELGLD